MDDGFGIGMVVKKPGGKPAQTASKASDAAIKNLRNAWDEKPSKEGTDPKAHWEHKSSVSSLAELSEKTRAARSSNWEDVVPRAHKNGLGPGP